MPVTYEMGNVDTRTSSTGYSTGYAEVCGADFAYANEFLALGGYAEWEDYTTRPRTVTGVSGHNFGYIMEYVDSFSVVNTANAGSGAKGNLLGSNISILANADCAGEFEGIYPDCEKAICRFLYGYRDLYSVQDASSLPAEPSAISLPKNSTVLGIVYENSKYRFEQGTSRSSMVSKFGDKLCLCAEGGVTVSGDTATFSGNAAMLDPGVKASWEKGGKLSFTLKNGGTNISAVTKGVRLSSPSYTFFRPKNDSGLSFTFSGKKMTVNMDPDENRAMLQFDIPGAVMQLSTLEMNNGTLVFGGLMSINTSVLNFADLSVQRLQLKYENGKYRMSGIQASGEVNMAKLGTFATASVSADINTFGSNEYYRFALEVDARLFSAEANLELRRLTSGALVPNNLFFAFSSPVGIALPPSLPIVSINGVGGGFSDLATTLNRAYSGLPPINITLQVTGKLLGIVEGTGQVTIGPTTQKLALIDGKILGINLLNEYSMTLTDNVASEWDSSYRNRFTGWREAVNWTIELGLPAGKSNSVITAGASYGWNMFSGINTETKSAKVSIGCDGTITGKVKLPDGWPVVGGTTLAEKNFTLSMGGSAIVKLKDTDVNLCKNYSLLQPTLKEITGKGSVSASFGVWKFKVKVAYNFGDKKVSITKGKPVRTETALLKQTDYESDGTLNGFFTVGSNVVRMSADSPMRSVIQNTVIPGVSLAMNGNRKNYTVRIDATAPVDDLLLEIVPKDGTVDQSFMDGLVLSDGTRTLTLKPMKVNSGNENGGYLYNAENPSAVTGMTTELALGAETGKTNCLISDTNSLVSEHAERASVMICVSETTDAGFDWSNVSVVAGEDCDIGMLYAVPDAGLNVSVSENTLTYSLTDADSNARMLRLYYSLNEGGRDYLVAEETAEQAGGTVALPVSGNALPDGRYYVTALLAERHYNEIDGEVYENWEVIDEKPCGAIDYANTDSPKPVDEVRAMFYGNETIYAEWDEPEGDCDGYKICVYQETEDSFALTDVDYDTSDTNITMALTSGSVNIETNSNVVISVTPYRKVPAEEGEEPSVISAQEVKSAPFYLHKAKPPVLTVSPEPDEDGVLPANCKSVTLTTDVPAYFEAWIVADETQLEAVDVSDTSATFSLPEDFEGSLILAFSAYDQEHWDTATTYLTLQRSEEAPFLMTDSPVFIVDDETSKYEITGTTQSGVILTAELDGDVNTGISPTVEVPVNEDGTFTLSGTASGSNGTIRLRAQNAYGLSTEVAVSGSSGRNCLNGHEYADGICSRCGKEEPCTGYTDINRSAWYHSAADFAIDRGLMGSTKTDALNFEPSTKVSRAMVASILYRMAGSPEGVEYNATFTDVKDGKWFTTAIEWCAANGLASGKGNGKFDPNGNVTRQELAVFMMKMAEFLGKDTSGRNDLSAFSDAAKVPAWAKTYVQWAVDAGMISGKTSGGKTLLAPADNATRAEFASIIMRFVQNIAEADE